MFWSMVAHVLYYLALICVKGKDFSVLCRPTANRGSFPWQ